MTEEEKERLRRKGSNESTTAVVQQVEYSDKLFAETKDDLLANGALEEMFVEWATHNLALQSFMSSRTLAQTGALDATSREHAAVSAAKVQLRKLYLAVPVAARRGGVSDGEARKIKPAGTLGRSAPRLLEHFKNTKGLVGKLDETLKPFFKGQSALTAHDAIISELGTASGTQDNVRSALPTETVDIHETKGRIVELIDDLNRIGRLANMDNAVQAARYNKDILLGSRRSSKKDAGSKTEDSNESAASGEKK